MAIIFNIAESLAQSKFNILQEPIKMLFEREVEAFEKASIIDKVFVMETMDTYQEEYRSSTAMDGFKPTADLEPAGLSDFEEGYGKIFRTQIWTNAMAISKQTIEDNQMATINPKALGFIKTYGRTRERYAVSMIGSALGKTFPEFKITASSGLGMDTTDGSVDGTKQQYFHNAHKGVLINGVSIASDQSNKFYVTLDFTGADASLESKLLDIIGQVESRMKKYTDDKGNILDVNPTRIVCAEDYTLVDALQRALKTKYTERMGENGVNLYYGKWELYTSPYLSAIDGFEDTDHAFLLIDPMRNREGMGAVFKDRTPLEINSWIDDNTKANVWDGRARFGAGFGDFRAIAYVNCAGGETSNSTQLTAKTTVVNNVLVTNTATAPVYTDEVS